MKKLLLVLVSKILEMSKQNQAAAETIRLRIVFNVPIGAVKSSPMGNGVGQSSSHEGVSGHGGGTMSIHPLRLSLGTSLSLLDRLTALDRVHWMWGMLLVRSI